MKIVLTKIQLERIIAQMKHLQSKRGITDVEVLFNPLMPGEIIMRHKESFTTGDGGVGREVMYTCINAKGDQENCLKKWPDNFYAMLKDYDPIDLNNPSIEVV
jgi:hypothetical protein